MRALRADELSLNPDDDDDEVGKSEAASSQPADDVTLAIPYACASAIPS